MDVEDIKKYEGKKCLIILNNNFKYTAIIPKNIDKTFSIIDRYGKEVTINCGFVAMIQEVENE
jgi:hypothetical protein